MKNKKTFNIGSILKDRRQHLGLTLRDAERLTGIVNTYISNIETGLRPNPSFIHIALLCNAYHMSLDELFIKSKAKS